MFYVLVSGLLDLVPYAPAGVAQETAAVAHVDGEGVGGDHQAFEEQHGGAVTWKRWEEKESKFRPLLLLSSFLVSQIWP